MSIKFEEEQISKRLQELAEIGTYAGKGVSTIMVVNKSGRDLVYTIETTNSVSGDKETKKRKFPKGMLGNISTTNELNVQCMATADGWVSTTDSCMDTAKQKRLPDDLQKTITVAKAFAQANKAPWSYKKQEVDPEKVIQNLLDQNPGLKREELELHYGISVTRGYFVHLDERARMDKWGGETQGEYLFVRADDQGNPVEAYFNDDGQDVYFPIADGKLNRDRSIEELRDNLPQVSVHAIAEPEGDLQSSMGSAP